MLSYQTAWLKYYYPEHFYAAAMSQEKTDGDGQNEISKYIAEVKKRGLNILPPDINTSGERFNVSDKGITYRVTMIKDVGNPSIEHIKELRPIVSFEDYLNRRVKKIAKKNVTINLIKAGAFDELNPNRAELMWEFDMSNRTKTQIKKEYQCDPYTWNKEVKLQWEKESLGLYLSSHPMERYGFHPLDKFENNEKCLQGGEVVKVETRPDKKGNIMAFITISTLYGAVRVLVFSSTWAYERVQTLFEEGKRILVRGKRSGDAIIFESGEELE